MYLFSVLKILTLSIIA